MPKSASAAGNGAPREMADFFYSPEAREDLLEIWEFIAQDDLEAADYFVSHQRNR